MKDKLKIGSTLAQLFDQADQGRPRCSRSSRSACSSHYRASARCARNIMRELEISESRRLRGLARTSARRCSNVSAEQRHARRASCSCSPGLRRRQGHDRAQAPSAIRVWSRSRGRHAPAATAKSTVSTTTSSTDTSSSGSATRVGSSSGSRCTATSTGRREASSKADLADGDDVHPRGGRPGRAAVRAEVPGGAAGVREGAVAGGATAAAARSRTGRSGGDRAPPGPRPRRRSRPSRFRRHGGEPRRRRASREVAAILERSTGA